MSLPDVSIIIPHFQTPELARLCLRSICRYTQNVDVEVAVIDNGSRDVASLEYLRQVKGIRLIERTESIAPGPDGHREAVEIGIRATNAPFILTIHTDTIPIRDDWLTWHLKQIMTNPKTAAVGTYKLELKSPTQRFLKLFERFIRGQKVDPRREHRPFIRSHCALYRRSALEDLNLNYDEARCTAGQHFHHSLEQHGYETRMLNVREALKRVVHLNHGTMALLPELGARRKTICRGRKRIFRFLNRDEVQAIYHDASLDRLEKQRAA